jgi:hypothetical protein
MPNDHFVRLTHNERLTLLYEAVQRGEFGRAKVWTLYSGPADKPIQFALLNLDTQMLSLGDLNLDGSITLDPRDQPRRAA